VGVRYWTGEYYCDLCKENGYIRKYEIITGKLNMSPCIPIPDQEELQMIIYWNDETGHIHNKCLEEK